MSRHIRMGGLDVDIADAAFDDRLADAYSRREHPLCRCQADGVQMYIARFEDRHILKRMPGTGAQHAPDCESYEPPSDLSGLSAVEGEAIVENVQDGTTALKLGFSLSKLGGRTAPAIGDSADPGDVRTDGARLSLKAMLHFLWDRAQFNRWRPAMAGRRNWAVVRKFVVEAASSSSAKGKPLSDALYIPEMFDPERADAIVQRRQAFLSRAVQSQGNRRSLAILIGELKEILFGVFQNLCPEGVLIGKVAAMTVEVAPRPVGHGPPDTPPDYKEMAPVSGGGHGEGVLVDECNGQAICTFAKRNPRKTGGFDDIGFESRCAHAAALPSTLSAASVSAVISCSTAFG